MRYPKILTALGVVLMVAAIIYGFAATKNGDVDLFFALAWGKVSMVDLYVGLLIFSSWIIYREQSWGRSLIWIVLLLVLGNLISCLYVLLALYASGGNATRFWMGQRAINEKDSRS